MKSSTLLLVLGISLMVMVVTAQRQVRFETDPVKGISKPVMKDAGNFDSGNATFPDPCKEAGINWQFQDAAAIGSKVKVSAQTGYTFTSWWLNDQRISLYGNSNNALWEVPITTDWEWAIDMTENGQWAVSAHNTIAQVFMTSSSTPFWELTLNGNIMGAKLSQDGSILFLAENNHNGTDSSCVSAFTIGNTTPLWQKLFYGSGTSFTKSKDDSRIVYCQYVGVNKMWVLDGSNGEKIFDAYYYNENPPALSFDGTVILNGDYSGNAFLYKYDEVQQTYIEKWTFKVGGGGTSAWVCGMGVSDDGSTVALGTLVFLTNGYEGEIYMFNSYSPVPVWVFSGTGDEVSSIDLNADGSLMVAATWGPLNQTKPDFYLFRKESDVPVFSIISPGSFFSVDISSDGTLCAVTGKAVHAREFGNGGFLYNIHSDPGGGIVSGMVDLENTTDESNARISINELDDYYNRSQPDGSYAIKFIPEGTYSVTASKIGYYPVTVQDVSIIEGETTILDFQLSETGNPPYDLYASKGAGLTINLTWHYTNSGDLLGFNIYRKSLEDDLFPDEPQALVTNQTFTFSDSEILPLTNYYYAVTGIIEAGVETPYSNISQGWMSTGFITDE
ncbi:MAG: carboxypeptidase regulatory-like domain-containing protein, partial [Bacteroidetes bacterium]|nr:carboxypeptidase regulatory-like domain-containing protein [Bacteroidota bacterium]